MEVTDTGVGMPQYRLLRPFDLGCQFEWIQDLIALLQTRHLRPLQLSTGLSIGAAVTRGFKALPITDSMRLQLTTDRLDTIENQEP